MKWYYVKDGQRIGPVEREELDTRVAEGALDGSTLVWRVGLSAWEPAYRVTELGVPPPVPAAPPPLPVNPPSSFVPHPNPVSGWTPVSPRRQSAASESPEYAGFWVRFSAKIIDGIVLYSIGLLVERAVATLFFDGLLPAPPDWPGVWRLLLIAGPINMLIAITYAVYFIRRHEATPGKRILGLRVVRADGGRLGVGRIIGRYFSETVSTVVFFAGYVMAAFDEEKRTLHDYMCDTRVVRGPRED
ncbi:MAG: RDD family protein [Verrucomicrobia bacterium]|nr:RDD family protein [Verrucomicrobiota bacterium]